MGNLASCKLPNFTEFIQTKPSSHEIDADDYKVIQEINDPRFGSLQLMKSKSRDHVLFVKERDLDYSVSQLDEIKFRSQLSNPYLLEIYGFRRANAENRIQIYFETFDSDLDKDIQRAMLDKTTFSEEKLNIILHCTLNVLSYLQENNVTHENITPNNILRIKDSYKLHENSIIANTQLLYNQALKSQNLRYLAPELLLHLARNDASPSHNSFKADIYSLGVCLLDAGVLNSVDLTLVDRKKLEIIQENLQARIKKFRELYSPQLSSVVEEMLSLDPKRRPDAITLYNRLPPKIREGKKRIFTPITGSPKQIEHSGSTLSGLNEDLKRASRLEALKQNPVSVSVAHYPDSHNSEIQIKTGSEVNQIPKVDKASHSMVKTTPENVEDNVKTFQTPQVEQHNTFTFAGNGSNTKDEAQVDYSEIKDMKISENIKNDPILSKFIKRMYEQQILGKSHNKSTLDKKSTELETSFKYESPDKKLPFLHATIDAALEKQAQNSSARPTQSSAVTNRQVTSTLNESKIKASNETELHSMKPGRLEIDSVGSVYYQSGNKDLGNNHLGYSSARYSKPTDLLPSQKPYSYLSGDLSEQQYRTHHLPEHTEKKLNFSPSSNVNNFSKTNSEYKREFALLSSSNKYTGTPKTSQLEDIDARIKSALLKSQENIEKSKNSGLFKALNHSYTAQKESSTLKSSHHSLRSSHSFHDKTLGYYSAEKLSSHFKIHSVAPFEHETKKDNEYENLSNEELAKLVAEIKREFQPKLKEFEYAQFKGTLQYTTSAKPLDSTKVESKDAVPVQKIEKQAESSHEGKVSTTSNPRTFDAQINELKKDIQTYFKQEGLEENK